MSCCNEHGRENEDGQDPTMASCCERDLAEQAKARIHLMRLRAVVPSNARAGVTAAVLGTPEISPDCQEDSWESLKCTAEEDVGKAYCQKDES